MNKMESNIAFETPSHFSFDSFSIFPSTINYQNDTIVSKRFSEKIGRGLGDIQNTKNQFNLNGTYRNSDDWISQIEYDRFMNEVWVGIVLTLIVISLVFCICSCFLYHQFRQWKRSFHRNIRQSIDIESIKLNMNDDESLPDYTLVSGLPSYDAAMEQLRSCPEKVVLMHTTIYGILPKNDKDPSCSLLAKPSSHSSPSRNQHGQHSERATYFVEKETTRKDAEAIVPSYEEALLESRP